MEVRDLWNKLANMAAADAMHDFDNTKRTQITEGIFSKFSHKHKGIGTPTPYTEPITSEYNILNTHLKFADTPDSASFRAKYFSGTFSPEEIRVRDIAYEVSSFRLNDNTLPSELMEFIAPTAGGDAPRDVALCVDTDKCGFHHIFEKPEDNPVKRTAYYVNPREFMNDGESKLDHSLTKVISKIDEETHSTRVISVDDSLSRNIEYEATDLESSDPTFYSIFDLTVEPIKENKLNIIFRNGDFNSNTTLIQKDKSTWNTVYNIGQSLLRLFESLRGTDYRRYYTLLQNKRSGDWLQVLSCTDKYREHRYKGLPRNIPITLVTIDILCAAYAIEQGVDCIFSWSSGSEQWLLHIKKKQAYEILSDAQRLATMVEALPKPDEPQEYLMNESYRRSRDAFIEYRESVISQIKGSLPNSLSIDDAERRIKEVFDKYGQIVSLRVSLRPIESSGEEALDTVERASLYKKNLSSLTHILKGKGEMINRIRAYVDKNHKDDRISSLVRRIRVFKRKTTDALEEVCSLFRDYMTEEERVELVHFLEKPLTFLNDVSRDEYEDNFLASAKQFLTLEGNGPKVPNWALLTKIIESELEPFSDSEDEVTPSADAAVPPIDADLSGAPTEANEAPTNAEVSGPEQQDNSLHLQLSRTYTPSMILALRFRNKCERVHRIEPCEGRRHITYTTTILFLFHLLRLMEDVTSRKEADPTYESVNEFVLKYVSQWLIHILNSLPGRTKDIFKEVECFILGMILDHESSVKDSPYLIEFIHRFMRDVYGYETDTYKVKECHFIDKSDFVKDDVFEERKPYTSIMEELKHHIHQTLGFLREYEEDPARIVEFRARQAALEASKKRLEEAHLETAKAVALDRVAHEVVLERSANLISTQEHLKESIEEEKAASKEVKKASDIESKAKRNVRKGVREALRMVRNAQKRGKRSAAIKRVERRIKTRRKTSDDFTNATLKRIGRDLGVRVQARKGSFVAS